MCWNLKRSPDKCWVLCSVGERGNGTTGLISRPIAHFCRLTGISHFPALKKLQHSICIRKLSLVRNHHHILLWQADTKNVLFACNCTNCNQLFTATTWGGTGSVTQIPCMNPLLSFWGLQRTSFANATKDFNWIRKQTGKLNNLVLSPSP